MKIGIVRFPGSNCDDDAYHAIVDQLGDLRGTLPGAYHERIAFIRAQPRNGHLSRGRGGRRIRLRENK